MLFILLLLLAVALGGAAIYKIQGKKRVPGIALSALALFALSGSIFTGAVGSNSSVPDGRFEIETMRLVTFEEIIPLEDGQSYHEFLRKDDGTYEYRLMNSTGQAFVIPSTGNVFIMYVNEEYPRPGIYLMSAVSVGQNYLITPFKATQMVTRIVVPRPVETAVQ